MSWPRTLFGRLMLILFAGLAAAHVLTFGFVLAERGLAMRGMMVSYAAADVASSVAMLDRLPAAERDAWLPQLQRPNYRFSIVQPASAPHQAMAPDTSPLAQSVTHALQQVLPAQALRVTDPGLPGIALRLHLRLQDGTPLAVDLIQRGLSVSPWIIGTLALQLAVLAALCWLAVRQAARPLARLAAAASTLDPARPAEPLPESGPREVSQASAAFNRMRRRIDEHLAERTQMLAAISHDLQTPITRMRLRADLLSDTAMRDKLHADLGQMQHLVEQGLAYARTSHAALEVEARTDLVALLESIVADYQDAAQPVHWLGGPPCTATTRPQALRRVVGNLIDNALKFAGEAEVALVLQEGGPAIQVLDRGPGIPAEEVAKVMQPFYRIEESRNRASGGTGLGLAIAQRLAQACHAELSLAPRSGGGLLARVQFAYDSTTTVAVGESSKQS